MAVLCKYTQCLNRQMSETEREILDRPVSARKQRRVRCNSKCRGINTYDSSGITLYITFKSDIAFGRSGVVKSMYKAPLYNLWAFGQNMQNALK